MAYDSPERVTALHINSPSVLPFPADLSDLTDAEQAWLAERRQVADARRLLHAHAGRGARHARARAQRLAGRPRGVARLEVPRLVGLRRRRRDALHARPALRLPHRSTGRRARSRRSIRLYAAEARDRWKLGAGERIGVPAAVAEFPQEILHPPREWAERTLGDLRQWTEYDRGGHFAAWEEPELLGPRHRGLPARGGRLDRRSWRRARDSRAAASSVADAAGEADVRLFAALDIPDRVRDGLEAWGARELTDPALRPVRAENLHMTLCFLGWTAGARRGSRGGASQLRAEPGPVRLRSQRPSQSRRAARASGRSRPRRRAAAGLQARLAGVLASAGLVRAGEAPVLAASDGRAHPRTERGKRRPRRVERPPGDLPGELAEPFDAVRVSLYRSDLRSDGAKYVSLANLNLPPSAK